MIEIIPAILTNNLTDLETRVAELNESVEVNNANISRIQIDVIDGEFVDNKTVDPSLLTNIDTNLSLDFHLMVKEPENWTEKCANAGADRIIGQIEMMNSQSDFIGRVQEAGLYVGLALDLNTSVDRLDPIALANVDLILLMAVKAGWGGQEFNKSVLEKIKKLDEIRVRDGIPFKICVDGGETETVIDDTHFAGADEVVVGKRLYNGSIAENVKRLQLAADKI